MLTPVERIFLLHGVETSIREVIPLAKMATVRFDDEEEIEYQYEFSNFKPIACIQAARKLY